MHPYIPHPSSVSAAALTVTHVSVGYGKTVVVEDVSFTVPHGQLTVLLGPNGSGKSTVLSTMGRLLRPRGGVVYLDGKSIHHLPTRDVARRMGILPQNPLTPEGLTVFDLVARGRYPHQGLIRQWSDTDSQAVEMALKLTDTTEFSRRAVDTLSGGQRQRCWIAMALAQQTDLILLDEPTTFLDLKFQVDILNLLHVLTRKHNRTVVAVLHDLNFAAGYADQMVFMKDGSIRGIVRNSADCTPALIADVFGVSVHVVAHPESGCPVFVPTVAGREDKT